MKRSIALTVILGIALGAAFAQDAPEPTVLERFPSALGAYVCYPSLGGLSYQHWFGRLGVQAAAGVLASSADDFDYNVNLGLQYLLYAEDFADWFSGGLYGYGYVAHTGLKRYGSAFLPTEYLGLGVGIETVLMRHLSINLDFMYVASVPFEVTFGFGGGLRYRF